MSKVVWMADSAMHFVSAKTDQPDDYELKPNETFIQPIDSNGAGLLAPATLLGQGQGWREATKEEHEAYLKAEAAKYPSQPQAPSAEQQMINVLGKQQMQQSADIKQMKEMINMLGKQQMANGGKE